MKKKSNHMSFYNESLNVQMVAKEVMELHYKLIIGLIPLSETVHELVHNGFLFIPTTNVYGAYKDFVERYRVYMDPQLLKTLKEAEEASKAYNFATWLHRKKQKKKNQVHNLNVCIT